MFTKTETLDHFLGGWDSWSDDFYDTMYEELAIQLMDDWIQQYGDDEDMVVSRFATILAMKYGLDASSLYQKYFQV